MFFITKILGAVFVIRNEISKCSQSFEILKQSVLFKKYIDFNTNKRKKNAVSSFEKDFFKLMNNCKTMENIRKRVKVGLVNNAKDYKQIFHAFFV